MIEPQPVPTPGPGQVLLQVHAGGLDRGAWHLMAGEPYAVRLAGYGVRRPKQPRLGLDVAGTAVALGEGVDSFAVGDEVFGIANGWWAEHAGADVERLALRPADVSPVQAAVSAVSGITALQALVDVADVEAGQRVLVAQDAHLHVEGRPVATTNVRRIADNIGVSKNTVTTHLRRLRDHGFVLHEEGRQDATGRWTTSRYVLYPGARIERFTHTPPQTAPSHDSTTQAHGGDAPPTPTRHDRSSPSGHDTDVQPADTVAPEQAPSQPRPNNGDTTPCRNSWDTDPTVSQNAGHRDLGHNNKDVVVFKEEQQQHYSYGSLFVMQILA